MPRTLGSSLVMTFGIRLAPGADAELVTPQLPAQPGPRVLLLPLPGVLRHGEAGEELGHVGQLCDGPHHLGGRHQDNGGRVGGQWPQVWRLQTSWFLGHLTSENGNHYSFQRCKISQRKNGKDMMW